MSPYNAILHYYDLSARYAGSTWLEIVDQYDFITIEVVGGAILQILTFYLPAALYISIDILFPHFSRRHKYQPNRQPTGRQILSAFLISLRNNILVSGAQYLFVLLKGKNYRSPLSYSPELPSLWTITWQFIYATAFREFFFYYIHRTLHHPFFYTRIHKFHHRFKAPVAFSAQYATITEHVIANTLPVILPHMLINAHAVSAWIFVGYQLWESAADHSGYDFVKSFPAAKAHDLHHEKFNMYFGVIAVMDWIHGTDKLPSERDKGKFGNRIKNGEKKEA